MVDMLTAAAIELACNACGKRYLVSLRQILLSQEMMHEGCSARGESECPPEAFAPLVERQLIGDLQRSWERLEERVRAIGGRLTLHEG